MEKKSNDAEVKNMTNEPVNEEENDEIIQMEFEDGTSENFYLLAELDYEGKWYAYLEPVDPPEDFEEGEVLVYEIAEDENGDDMYIPVDDEDLLEKLVDNLNAELEKTE